MTTVFWANAENTPNEIAPKITAFINTFPGLGAVLSVVTSSLQRDILHAVLN